MHPHYASAEVSRDREAARPSGSSLAVEQVTVGPSVLSILDGDGDGDGEDAGEG